VKKEHSERETFKVCFDVPAVCSPMTRRFDVELASASHFEGNAALWFVCLCACVFEENKEAQFVHMRPCCVSGLKSSRTGLSLLFFRFVAAIFAVVYVVL
jgi:hypothetical protein